MALKSFTSIVTDMIDYIRGKRTNLDTSVGTITRDVFIEAPANEIEDIYAEIEHVSLIHSLFYEAQMSADELDRLVYNWGITRNPATKSTGGVSFRRNSIPTEDIVVPVGTIVTTQKGTLSPSVRFIVTEQKTMLASEGATYYNSVTGFYEIDAAAEADIAGVSGNVSAGSIIVLETSVTGISSVENTGAMTGGTDQESNEALAARALLSLTGNNVGTETGYESTILSNEFVNDAFVIGPGDSLMTRDGGLGGMVDIYVQMNLDLGTLSGESTDTYTYTDLSGGSGATDPLNDRILNSQPVKEITSVTGSTTGPFVENTDFKLTKDTAIYANSTQANDKMQWLLDSPVSGEIITIGYSYYSIMSTLDDLIDTNRSITADVLVKHGIEVEINMELTVYSDSTITDSSAFEDSVSTAISNYINVNALGIKVDQSDIVGTIYTNVNGTERIVLPFAKLEAPSKGLVGLNDSIQLAGNEYPRAGTVTIHVVLSS